MSSLCSDCGKPWSTGVHLHIQLDENNLYTSAGNEINEILVAHKEKWSGDNEIQDMLAEAFMRGVRFERGRGDE